LSDEAFETGLYDRLHDGGVIEFLCLVDLVSSGDTAGVVMGDVGMVIADGADDVALIDLHMIDVVKQFELGGSDAMDEIDPPGGAIALVVSMVDPAVEEFHHDDDFVLFGDGHDFLQPFCAVLPSCLIVFSATVA